MSGKLFYVGAAKLRKQIYKSADYIAQLIFERFLQFFVR